MQSATSTTHFAMSSAACYFVELYLRAYPEEIQFVHDNIDGDGRKKLFAILSSENKRTRLNKRAVCNH